nr:MAG: replication protein O [Bacteriophage sp.]
MCNGSNWGFSFLIMTYNILIDQRFAVANKLTIVQTTTLAACMTLPTWTNTITVDGIVWYQYSETKMVDDFPLLFSIPKRVYKNIKELADRGFIELSSFGKTKYLRFTEKCKTWNRSETDFNQSENGLQDYNINIQQSENGLNNSPKTDFNQSENGLQDYNINNNNINNNNINNTIKKDAKASKENPDGFSQADFSNEEKTVKASIVYGFTPELLDVRKQVIDKVDNYFAKLVFPFDSDEFKRNFYILMCQPKWRTSQKSFSAIQANLNGLSKYPEEFALILIKESISKGWAALEYDSTPEKYEKWEKMKRSVKTEQQSSKEIADMMKYLNNDFD